MGGARPESTVVVLSDLHVRTDGPLLETIDTLPRLRAAVDAVLLSEMPVDAVVLCGDLTDDGAPAAYAALRGELAPLLRATGAALVALGGNHDDPQALAEAFGAQALRDGVLEVAGLRIVTLDTTRPGRDTGHLEAGQLSWLADELDRAPGMPTLLAMHHTPLPTDVDFVAGLGLEHPDALAQVLRGRRVDLLVCGHSHAPAAGLLAGAPVITVPALVYNLDAAPPAGRMRTWADGGLLRVDRYGEALVARPVALPAAPSVLFDRPQVEMAALLEDLRARGRA